MGSEEYSERYYRRVADTRRRYFFEKWGNLKGLNNIPELFKWIKSDVIYAAKWGLNVPLQIRAYGNTIRKEYGLSYYHQWVRLMFVVFVLRSDPDHFRKCLLYKPNTRARMKDYVFTHHHIQNDFARLTHADEIDIIENKFKFFQHCRSAKIATPEVLAVFKNGENIYQTSTHYIPQSSVFIKKLAGGKGEGTKRFNFKNGFYTDNENNSYSQELLISHIKSESIKHGGIVVQPALENHELWKCFTLGSLATCRLVTAKSPEKNNETIPLFCCFRMPVGNSDADNYALGGIITSVHLETGELGIAVTSKPINGKFEFTEHPNTKHQIKGAFLPQWHELKKFTLNLHNHFNSIFVGWDVCLTTQGFCVIEGNIRWAAGSYEIPFQDSLKNTIYPELFEKWMDKYAALYD